MERANPGFFHVFVIEQHFQRFLDTQKYNRPGPWYFFFGVDIIGTLPWTPLMVAGVLIPLFRWQKTDARDRYLALWAALIFLFFTRSSSKLITYILPLFAHQALLAGRLLTRIHRMPKIGRILKNTAVGLAALFLSAALIAPFLAPRLEIPVTIPQGLLWSGIAALCALAASQGFLARVQAETDHRNIAAGCALCALFVIAALTSGTGYLDHELSVKRLGTEISRRIKSLSDKRPIRILAYNKYLHGIPFYTRRPVDVVNWIGELHYAKRFDRFRPRFGDDQTIRSLPDKNAKVYVTVQKRDLKDYLELSPKKKMTQLTEIGPWMLVEY
jgi:4-amino-4-deoxy-L-arabinose transferase-like glycosyltransferase